MTNPADFTDLSEWIDLAEALSDCCEVGAEVVVYGKVQKFRGVIDCVNSDCSKIKILYDIDETGYPEDHVIETSDIEFIRCKACCDITWYQIDDCSSPDLTGLPSSQPDGQIWLYSGDFNDPDCLFVYQGFGDHQDIASYTKIPSNHVIDFDLDEYNLSITMKDGTVYTVTLAKDSVASLCLDSISLDCDYLEEL